MMKNVALFWMLFVGATGWCLGDSIGGEPVDPNRPRDYSVHPNKFREHYLRAHAIPDLSITLEGDWTDTQVNRLAEILKELHAGRSTRPADIYEFTRFTTLQFRIGNAFAFTEDYANFDNGGAISAGGISEITTLIFTLPYAATDAELKAAIGPNLPEVLVRDKKRRDEWRAMVADTQRRSLFERCRRVVRGF